MNDDQTFTAWLADQTKRYDPVGDLARDVAVDDHWPHDKALPALHDHLVRANACSAALDALRRAWAEWSGETNRKERSTR